MVEPGIRSETVRGFNPERLTENLNEAQVRAVTVEASPLRVLAGAGSGKTRVLTHRIAYRAHNDSLDPSRVMAVTFTRKAASELRSRLIRLGISGGVTSGTFHSIAYAQLRQRWEERDVRPPELLDRKVGFVSRLMPQRQRSNAIDVVGEIEWASARMVQPDGYERQAARANRRPPVEPGVVAEIYERYLREKKSRRVVDFDDLLRLAVRDLEADPVYAAARHWRFRHLFVDEFQDVNPLQYRLIRALLGPESDLCAVGDPNQAIYAWNGADARYINDFDSFFPGSTTVVLDRNYRSTPQILAAANAVLAEGGAHNLFKLRAQRRDGQMPQVLSHDDATSEARSLGRTIRDRHGEGRAWSHQAVLVRTNAQATVIVEEFRRMGIPHAVRGTGDLLAQPEVRDALAMLRRSPSLAMGLADIEDVIRQRAPLFYASRLDPSDADDTSGAHHPPDDRRADDSVPHDSVPHDSVPEDSVPHDSRSGAKGRGSTTGATRANVMTDDRAANLMELVRLGSEYGELDPSGGIAGFIAWITSALRGGDANAGDVVEIMSFHAAKGLEWPVVHIAGLEEGFVPIHHARDLPGAVEEERRLLYVAMTRARDELVCNWSESREFGTRKVRRKPSPWISTIEATLDVAPPVVDARSAAVRARTVRRDIIASRSGRAKPASDRRKDSGRRRTGTDDRAELGDDGPLFETLRRWRKQQADAADVPAYVVFTDETLIDLTKRRPRTKQQLLDIRGIGAVKAERYADEVLEIIAGSS